VAVFGMRGVCCNGFWCWGVWCWRLVCFGLLVFGVVGVDAVVVGVCGFGWWVGLGAGAGVFFV